MKIRYYLIALGILIFDHITKWFAVTTLANHSSIDIIRGYLNLSYVENTGVAFGLFDSVQSSWKPYMLAALAIIAFLITWACMALINIVGRDPAREARR